jgi:hypothetical protein
MVARGKPPAADEDADCVTQVELRAFMKNITEVINVNHDRYAATLKGIERKISGVVDQLEALEIRIPPAVQELNGNEQDERATRDEELRHRLHRNCQGMGGNNDNNHDNRNQDNRDPFAKVEFTIPAFYGAYDAEAYLHWEMTIEQKLKALRRPTWTGGNGGKEGEVVLVACLRRRKREGGGGKKGAGRRR